MAVVHRWQDIAHHLSGDRDFLLLGNGASMAFDRCFGYSSLLQTARDRALISEDVGRVFDHLETEDFERVLNLLWHTATINSVLGVEEDRSQRAYASVRDALVQAVNQNHASHADVEEHLPRAAQFMAQFATVATLNYDLTAYWAMMGWNRENGIWFKDAFVDGYFREDWEDLRRAIYANRSTLVFYPHGSLYLGLDLLGFEEKIVRANEFDDLLRRIVADWNRGAHTPLFVSEGDSSQKVRAIRRSAYLSTVFDEVLPDPHETITFLGFGFNENDEHILERLSDQNPETVLASYFMRDGENHRHPTDELSERLSQAFPDSMVHLFDATSPGVWIYPR